MKPINKYRFIAYDALNEEYKECITFKQAVDWLKEYDEEGIPSETEQGKNFIAEIQYRSVVTPIERKEDYHVHTDECPDDYDLEEREHSYEKIDWGG